MVKLNVLIELKCDVCGQEAWTVSKYTLCPTHIKTLEEYTKYRLLFHQVKYKIDSLKKELFPLLEEKPYMGNLTDVVITTHYSSDGEAYNSFKRRLRLNDKYWQDNIRSRKTRKDKTGKQITTYLDKRGVEQAMPEVPLAIKQDKNWGKTKKL